MPFGVQKSQEKDEMEPFSSTPSMLRYIFILLASTPTRNIYVTIRFSFVWQKCAHIINFSSLLAAFFLFASTRNLYSRIATAIEMWKDRKSIRIACAIIKCENYIFRCVGVRAYMWVLEMVEFPLFAEKPWGSLNLKIAFDDYSQFLDMQIASHYWNWTHT